MQVQVDTVNSFDASNILTSSTGGTSNGVIASSTSTPNGQSGEIATWGPGTGNVRVKKWSNPGDLPKIPVSPALAAALPQCWLDPKPL